MGSPAERKASEIGNACHGDLCRRNQTVPCGMCTRKSSGPPRAPGKAGSGKACSVQALRMRSDTFSPDSEIPPAGYLQRNSSIVSCARARGGRSVRGQSRDHQGSQRGLFGIFCFH